MAPTFLGGRVGACGLSSPSAMLLPPPPVKPTPLSGAGFMKALLHSWCGLIFPVTAPEVVSVRGSHVSPTSAPPSWTPEDASVAFSAGPRGGGPSGSVVTRPQQISRAHLFGSDAVLMSTRPSASAPHCTGLPGSLPLLLSQPGRHLHQEPPTPAPDPDQLLVPEFLRQRPVKVDVPTPASCQRGSRGRRHPPLDLQQLTPRA